MKAEQMRAALASEVIPPLDRTVTASFGVAELMRDEPGESLLARADKALYQAKEAGRNRVVAAKVDSYT
jgi:diguanylate cyclase (GGDEF)-like protein